MILWLAWLYVSQIISEDNCKQRTRQVIKKLTFVQKNLKIISGGPYGPTLMRLTPSWPWWFPLHGDITFVSRFQISSFDQYDNVTLTKKKNFLKDFSCEWWLKLSENIEVTIFLTLEGSPSGGVKIYFTYFIYDTL